MKGGGGKRKASLEASSGGVGDGGASIPSDGVDLCGGDGGGIKVKKFEGNKGTQLWKS